MSHEPVHTFARVWNLWQDREAAIQRVRDLHKPAPWCCAMCDGEEEKRCAECFDQPYPCPTIKALDGVVSETSNVTPNVTLDGEQG